jgi:hypothetical protein
MSEENEIVECANEIKKILGMIADVFDKDDEAIRNQFIDISLKNNSEKLLKGEIDEEQIRDVQRMIRVLEVL